MVIIIKEIRNPATFAVARLDNISRHVSDDDELLIPQWLSRLARRTYMQYEKCEGREFDPPLGNVFFVAPPLFNSWLRYGHGRNVIVYIERGELAGYQ